MRTTGTLSALDVSYNTIKDEGAKLFYKLIQSKGVLKKVKLEENFISSEGKEKLGSLTNDDVKIGV